MKIENDEDGGTAKSVAEVMISRAQRKSLWELSVTKEALAHENSVHIRSKDDRPPSLTFDALPIGSVHHDLTLQDVLRKVARREALTGFTGNELSLWSRSASMVTLDSLHNLRVDAAKAKPVASVAIVVIENVGGTYTKVQSSAFTKLRSQDEYPVRWLVEPDHAKGHWYTRAFRHYSTYIGALKSIVECPLAREADILCVMVDGVTEPEVPDRREIAFAERVWMTGTPTPMVTSGGSLLICPLLPEHRTFLQELADNPNSETRLHQNVRYLFNKTVACNASSWTRLIIRD